MKKIELTDEEHACLLEDVAVDLNVFDEHPNGRDSWRCRYCGAWDFQNTLKHKPDCFGLRLLKKLREA